MQRQKNTQPANEGAAPGTTSKHALRVLRQWGCTDLKPVTDDASSIYPERGSISTLGGAENDLQPFATAEEGGSISDTPLALGGSPQRSPRELDVRSTSRPRRLAGKGTPRSPAPRSPAPRSPAPRSPTPRSPKLEQNHGRGPPALGGSGARRLPGFEGSGTRRRLPKLEQASGATEIRFQRPKLVMIPPRKRQAEQWTRHGTIDPDTISS
jgi:hypothetical protein